jgi:hypothetical protein
MRGPGSAPVVGKLRFTQGVFIPLSVQFGEIVSLCVCPDQRRRAKVAHDKRSALT